jgi:hypothetical protein
VTRLKPSGRGVQAYADLRPTQDQLAHLHGWLQGQDDVLSSRLQPLRTFPSSMSTFS